MGRRPNPVILQFFERGAKLDNASNRYEHSCRSCGEKFPKGRTDSLTAHIAKCPALSAEERNFALQSLHKSSGKHGRQSEFSTASGGGGDQTTSMEQASSHQMSALETLAEVSRQHLEPEAQPEPITFAHGKRKRDAEDEVRPQTSLYEYIASEEHDDSPPTNLAHVWDSPSTNDNGTAMSRPDSASLTGHESSVTTQKHTSDSSMNIEANDVLVQADVIAGRSPFLPLPPTSRLDEPIFPISSGTEEMAGRAAAHRIPASDQPGMSAIISDVRQEISLPLHGRGRAQSGPTRKPHEPFLNNFSAASGVSRARQRGRFSDSRREQVREMRKQGACIRCRMLKKPCSDGVPCGTCKKLVSSRLWKHPCVRTRLGEEFDFYSAGIHGISHFHESNAVKKSVTETQRTWRVEARFAGFDSASSSVVFSCLEHSLRDADSQSSSVYLPSVQTECYNELEQYIQQNTKYLFLHEPSHFIKESVRLAQILLVETTDTLLAQATSLWTATMVLVAPADSWNISIGRDPDAEVQTQGQDEGTPAVDNPSSAPISRVLQSQSQTYILSFLRATVERICAYYARLLVNEIERRLLMRSQASAVRFETFLASVILLNCTEKMCWLFQGWVPSDEVRGGHSDDGGAEQDSLVCQIGSERGSWHAERPPAELVAKGESTADLLAMLLRVRAIPPKTKADAHGIMKAVTDKDETRVALDAQPQGQAVQERQLHPDQSGHPSLPVKTTFGLDSNNQNASDAASVWFDAIRLKQSHVRQQVEAAESRWDPHDCRCYEMRFTGRLLLQDD